MITGGGGESGGAACTPMCGADVETARMRSQEEVIGALVAAVRCGSAEGQFDGMGITGLGPQKLTASFTDCYVHDESSGEDSPQRAEWIGDDDFGLHASEILLRESQRYRPAASIFVESLPQSKRARATPVKVYEHHDTAFSAPDADLINALPDECLQEIFGFLPKVRDRCACASVCMRWLMLQSRMHRDEFKPEPSRCQNRCIQENACVPKHTPESSSLEKVDSPTERSQNGVEEWSEEAHMEEVDVNTVDYEAGAVDADKDVEEEEPRVERQPQWAIGELSRNLEGRKATDVRLAFMAIGALARGGLGRLTIRGGSVRVGRGVTDSGLIAIGNCCAALRSLTLWDCNNIGNVGLAAIGNGCRLLEKLDLMRCSQVGDEGIQAVAKGCLLITTLNLDSCPNIGDEGLQAFGKWSGVLSTVSISNCPMVGSSGISMLARGCQKLKKLKLEKISVGNEGLVAIGEHCRSLTRAKFASLSCCDEEGFMGFCGGAGLRQLRSLLISCCPGITDVSLEKVGKVCKDLKMCVLSQCEAVTDIGLKAFMQCCLCLDSLQLEKCHSITQAGVYAALTQCKGRLRSLGLSKCDGLNDVGVHSFVPPLTCLSLKSLQVAQCKGVGNGCVVMMGLCCPSLEHLDLSGLTSITDGAVISILQRCGDHLLSVNLTKCINITDAAISALATYCPNLEILTLDGCCQVGDIGLHAVAVECSFLKELDVSGLAITDCGIQALVTLRGMWLHSLTFTGCVYLTDESLSAIEHCCPALGALNLKNCPLLSNDGLNSLQSNLWGCEFECS